MKTAKNTDHDVYRACITWNIPALRKMNHEDADHFKHTVQLLPSTFNDAANSTPKRMTPLRRAAEGLKAELAGELESARAHYEIVAKKQQLPGLLGALLIAWMPGATEKDFDRVERKLDTLSGPGTRDTIARSHCKLATWSYDRGWTDRSQHHYEEAHLHAGKNLRVQLDRIGHWFGRDTVVHVSQARDDMITFPWIDGWVDGAARTFVEKQLRESIKSPGSRTWSFGIPAVEGTDIQSAGMQASWAGALWMLPQINRIHAALILAKSNDSEDVARAIALWAKGSGRDTNKLVSSKEAALTESTIEDLLFNQLHEGRGLRDREVWLDICHSLWAELPDRLVDDIVRNYEGPQPGTRLYGGAAVKELSLFAKLLVRSGLAVEKVQSFNDWEVGLLARSMHGALVSKLPPNLPERLLQAGISQAVLADDDWADNNWDSLLTCWTLLDGGAKDRYRQPLIDALPDTAIPAAVAIAPGLVPESRADARMRTSLGLLSEELRDSERGSWTGWSVHPATDVARLAIGRGRISDSAVQQLVAIAVAPTTNSMQRRSCLTALSVLARAGLVQRDQVAETFTPVTVHSVMTDDAAVDQRLEDVTRLALMVEFSHDQTLAEGPLLAASRDPDTQIRVIAVRAVCDSCTRGQSSPSFDATLLGALYDPHPRVQAEAIPALWRGHFESLQLREVARARVVDIFPTAHRELRATIAHQISSIDGEDAYLRTLRRLAIKDRSWVVRGSAAHSRQ